MRKRIFAVILIVCLLLSACGSTEQTANETGETKTDAEVIEKQWFITEMKLPDADEALNVVLPVSGNREVLFMGMAGEKIYRYVRQYDENGIVTNYCIQQMEAPYTEWKNCLISLEGMELRRQIGDLATFTAEGELYFLYDADGECYRESLSIEKGYSIDRINAEDMTELLEKAVCWYIHDGKNYLYTSDGLMCFQEDFVISETIAYQNAGFIWQMAETASGERLYLSGGDEDGNGFYLWAEDKNVPVVAIDDIFYNGPRSCVIFFSETEGYLCDTEGIRQFSVEKASVEQKEVFRETGYYPEDICGAAAREDGSLLMLVQTDTGYLLLERAEKEISDEKKTLVLADSVAGTFLKEAVVRFNQQSEEYEIVLRERSEGEYYEDYNTRIQAEISGGGGPDLIATDLLNFENYAQKGYLRNLSEDFEEQREEIVESVWNSGLVEENLYAVAYAFAINTLEVRKDIVGDRNSWTLEEAMQITRESDASVFANSMDGPSLFYYLGIMNESNNRLIDWENGVCHLNSPEAVELLEFAAEYSDKQFEEGDFSMTTSDRYRQGDILAQWSFIMYIQALQNEEEFYQAQETERVYIGYPVENGESRHRIGCSSIAVNQACEYPEGAVEFLRFLISEENQGRIVENQTEMLCGFPVRQDSLEEMFDKALDGYYNDANLMSSLITGEVPAQSISRESLEQLWEVIETAKPYSRRTDALATMVWEETESFFSKDKTAQEVLDILQNRAQLYMNEIM